MQPLSIEQQTNTPLPARRLRGRSTACFACVVLSTALLVIVARGSFHLSITNLVTTLGSKNGGGTQKIQPVCVDGSTATRTSPDEIAMNRAAKGFRKQLIPGIASSGFFWDDGDSATRKWRPQGVTTVKSSAGRRYLAVSWYGRRDEGYAARGARVSVVEMGSDGDGEFQNKTFPYRHTLLVDKEFCTLPNIHAGGIEYWNGSLHVVDSRRSRFSIISFSLNEVYELGPNLSNAMFGYRYVLRGSSVHPLSVKPSFVSFDRDLSLFVVGTYNRCGPKMGVHTDSKKCMQAKNELAWFDLKQSENVDPCGGQWPEMQGATSVRFQNRTLVLTSSSYGAIAPSHLHLLETSADLGNGECPSQDRAKRQITFRLPPGLEDLHTERIASNGRSSLVWSLTEFGTRMVLSFSLSDIVDAMDESSSL